jgi:hypothetical protein
MSDSTERKERFKDIRKSIIISIIVNAVLPVAFYTLLKYFGASELVALIVPASIPTAWVIGLWALRRRIDWLGVYAVLNLLIECGVAAVFRGSTLLLKAHSLTFTGPLGLVLLVSALINKPLLVPLIQLVKSNDPNKPNIFELMANHPEVRKRISFSTGLIGFALLLHASIETYLALKLPTETFLLVSKTATWVAIILIGLALWALRAKNKEDA